MAEPTISSDASGASTGAEIRGIALMRRPPYVGIAVSDLNQVALLASISNVSFSFAFSILLVVVSFGWDASNDTRIPLDSPYIVIGLATFVVFVVSGFVFLARKKHRVMEILNECPEYWALVEEMKAWSPKPKPYWFIRVWRWHLLKMDRQPGRRTQRSRTASAKPSRPRR